LIKLRWHMQLRRGANKWRWWGWCLGAAEGTQPANDERRGQWATLQQDVCFTPLNSSC
jgi:hypothetical protein